MKQMMWRNVGLKVCERVCVCVNAGEGEVVNYQLNCLSHTHELSVDVKSRSQQHTQE